MMNWNKKKETFSQQYRKSPFLRALKGLINVLPLLMGIILLIGLIESFLSFQELSFLFQNNFFLDTLIGNVMGSLFAGNALNSYIIGYRLLEAGVSIYAVTAFLIAWVTVGLVQIPAESIILGKQFALYRNIFSFFLSFFVALLTGLTLGIIG